MVGGMVGEGIVVGDGGGEQGDVIGGLRRRDGGEDVKGRMVMGGLPWGMVVVVRGWWGMVGGMGGGRWWKGIVMVMGGGW